MARDPAHDDPLRLAALYRAHVQFVWRTLVRFGIPERDAEDVVHEVFLVAGRRLAGFDPSRAAPRSWLYGLARGVAANWRRADRRSAARIGALAPPAGLEDLDAGIARAQAAALVHGFLAELDPRQREVFVLCDIEGLRAPEVAVTLGQRLTQVYSRLRLARRHFVAFLGRHGLELAEHD